MTAFVALLRAVNVGGTGKLPMSTLRQICAGAGFADVQTDIASGNVVFTSRWGEARVRAAIEERLHAHAGKPVGVFVRTAAEMTAVVRDNPFAEEPSNPTVAIFLHDAPPADALATVTGRVDEKLALGTREIHVGYGAGMRDSKPAIPAGRAGTARNLSTVAALATLAGA